MMVEFLPIFLPGLQGHGVCTNVYRLGVGGLLHVCLGRTVSSSARGHKTDIQPVVLFTTRSPLSESLCMVIEDISCPFLLMKLIIYAEESKFLEETLDMTVALICHVLLLLIMSFASSHMKQTLVYFLTFFFLFWA